MIAPGGPTFVIAEIGGNAGGDAALAVRMIEAAADAGADAVKFQMILPGALYREGSPGAAKIEREAFARADWTRLRDAARAANVVFLSTPFDAAAVLLLESLEVPAYKVASCDIDHHPLLERIAATGKPVFLSVGAATFDEIEEALTVLRHGGAGAAVLLQCTMAYPCPPEEANLRVLPALAERFGLPVGLSDHTEGIEIALAAVALGAAAVEKHVTIDRSLPGGDNAISILPEELRALVRGARRIEAALGSGVKAVSASEALIRPKARRAVVAARDLPEGHVLCAQDLSFLRPADGLSPREVARLLGRRLFRAVRADHPVLAEDLE